MHTQKNELSIVITDLDIAQSLLIFFSYIVSTGRRENWILDIKIFISKSKLLIVFEQNESAS